MSPDCFKSQDTECTAVLSYLGGFEGVVGREGDVQEEDAPLVHGARWSQDGRPPLIDVVSFWASTAGTEGKATFL